MRAFQRVHPREVEEGAASAWLDKGIRPGRRILELLAAGELEYKGQRLPASDVPEATFRAWIRRETQRRSGTIQSPLAKMPHRDAIENLRIRLLSAADAVMEAEQRKGAKQDLARLQQCARLVREAASIPTKNDPRPAQPGQRDPQTGEHNGTRTKGGLGAEILAAHRRGETAQKEAQQTEEPDSSPVQTGDTSTTVDMNTNQAEDGEMGSSLGSGQSERVVSPAG